jgi:putative flippase GtrA
MSLRGQIVSFGLVGVMNTAITAAIIAALTMSGLDLVAANAIGFAAGLANSFYMNRRFTFGGAGSGTAIPFAVSFAVAYLLNLAVVLLTGPLVSYHALIPQAAGMLTYNVAFFVLMKLWVFAGASEPRKL